MHSINNKDCHCERSEAILARIGVTKQDCRAALAMTGKTFIFQM